MVVEAVGGRSPATVGIAALEDDGRLPVSSSFRIRCLRSSTSSQMVDGAVVDTVEAVSSAGCVGNRFRCSKPMSDGLAMGDEWYWP